MAREIQEFGLTRVELIAALVEDSIGYLVPLSAELHINEWERGQDTCFCERCLWVFKGDLQRCLAGAARRWRDLPEEKRQHLLNQVEQIARLDAISQSTVGLMWPTLI